MKGPQQFFVFRRQFKVRFSQYPFRLGHAGWGSRLEARTAEAAQSLYRSNAAPPVQLLAQAIMGIENCEI